MATTVPDIQTSLAYRLGENAAPTNITEKARRLRFINEALRSLWNRNQWWFSEDTASLSAVSNQEEYSLPADYRDIIDLKVDGKFYTLSNYADLADNSNILGPYSQTLPVISSQSYVLDNTLHVLPKPTANGTDNIEIRYFKGPATLTESSILEVPDLFADAIVAFAYARICQLDSERGSAADGFDEFEEIIVNLTKEHNRHYLFGKSVLPNLYLVE